MYQDDLDMRAEEDRRKRLAALQENQGWLKDVRPFLLARREAAITAIRDYEDMTHWKGVGIEAHIEELMNFIEGDRWKNPAVPQKANQEAGPKASLRERIANLFRG